MDGHPSSYSDCEKGIGIYIDQDLTFSKHTSMAVNKVNKATAITRTFDYIYRHIHAYIYIKALIRPLLDYAGSVWYPHIKKDIEEIEMCSNAQLNRS